MKYCLYYWIFEPLRGRLVDNPGRMPTFSVPTNYKGSNYEFALFCDHEGVPEFARIRIPDLDKEEIPESILPLLQILNEHLLSILKLTYREDIQLFPMTAWSFFNEDKPYEVGLDISMHNPVSLNTELVRNLFSASMDFREEIRLLVDGIDARLPLQYRFLSFYKIIENEFKVSGHWHKKQLDDFLGQYAIRFHDQGFKGKPSSVLHETRDKCAHIKTGTKKEVLGVTHLNHKEAVRTGKLLPVLRDVCRDLINKKATGKLMIGDITPWFEKLRPNSYEAPARQGHE